MAEIISLNKKRKAKARLEKEKKASKNRLKFGRTKKEQQQVKLENSRDERLLDGQHLDKNFETRHPFICRLVGLNSLLKKTIKLIQTYSLILEGQLVYKSQLSRLNDLKNLKILKPVSTFSNEIKLNQSLNNKYSLIKTIPKRAAHCMPHLFECFGKNNEIIAAPKISGGMPMTYANLRAEKKATLNSINKSRDVMVQKRMNHPYINDLNDPAKTESNIIDGANGTLSYLDREFNQLTAQAPYIEIDNLTPVVSYPSFTS